MFLKLLLNEELQINYNQYKIPPPQKKNMVHRVFSKWTKANSDIENGISSTCGLLFLQISLVSTALVCFEYDLSLLLE